MDWTCAPNIVDAPLEPARRRFLPAWFSAFFGRIEAFLECEQAQLPSWLVVSLGVGIAAWLWMPGPAQWSGFIMMSLGVAAAGSTVGASRAGRALIYGGLAAALGCG